MNGRRGRGVVWWLRNAPVSFEKFHQNSFKTGASGSRVVNSQERITTPPDQLIYIPCYFFALGILLLSTKSIDKCK